MSAQTVIGIVGCGVISDSYLTGASRSALVRVKGCADVVPAAAAAKAEAYGIEPMTVEQLLADPEIGIVVNLTVPAAHAAVSMQILDAGKHVYSEKPLAATFADAQAVLARAAHLGLRVGCAPDTFLGAAHQAVRRAVDTGLIGTPVAGSAAVLSHGMEAWHPNPGFFFRAGGGPVLDMGPYYVTQLVNLLGPVASVSAVASIGNPTRTVTSEPRNGEIITVEVPTTVNAVLRFAGGANVSFSASWDVWSHRRQHLELYGTEGSIVAENPNFFGGTPTVSVRGGEWQPIDISPHPFGVPNRELRSGAKVADYRIVGLLDMAVAIGAGRAHRADGAMALHVLEVLEALERSSATGTHVAMATTCERPAPVPAGEGEDVLSAG
jgi:predicted dehydrogenase